MNSGGEKAVAYALLNEDEVAKLGSSLKRVYPVPQDTTFDELLRRLELAVGAQSAASER